MLMVVQTIIRWWAMLLRQVWLRTAFPWRRRRHRSVRGPRTRARSSSNSRRNFTSTDISVDRDESSSLRFSTFPSVRLKSGSRTDAWSTRKVISLKSRCCCHAVRSTWIKCTNDYVRNEAIIICNIDAVLACAPSCGLRSSLKTWLFCCLRWHRVRCKNFTSWIASR